MKGKKMELIDKNELHNTLLFMESMEDLSYGKKIYDKVIQQVVNMPTIEAEKHGRWNGDTCSVCGFSWCDVTYEAPQTEMSFCPNCGADMRGVKE